MDHELATRTQAVERYLLEEMSPAERDAFEEHYFSCEECAEAIQAAAGLVATIRLQEPEAVAAPVRAPVDQPARGGFWAWLRPLVASPVFGGLLLAVIGFQNLVQVPALRRELSEANSPRVPVRYVLQGDTRSAATTIEAAAGRDLLLETTVDVTGADREFSVAILDQSGTEVVGIAGPIHPDGDLLQVLVPLQNLKPGRYTLVVNAYSGGEHKRAAFEVAPY